MQVKNEEKLCAILKMACWWALMLFLEASSSCLATPLEDPWQIHRAHWIFVPSQSTLIDLCQNVIGCGMKDYGIFIQHESLCV